MKRSATIYGVLATILETWLARAYQTIVPGFRNIYAGLYGDSPRLPHLTELLLNQNWTLYIPPLLILLGYVIAFKKQNQSIANHALIWSLLLFLVMGVIHAMSLFLPLVVTMGKIE
jgi:hypothetical protein